VLPLVTDFLMLTSRSVKLQHSSVDGELISRPTSIHVSDEAWTAVNGGNMNPFYLNPEERFALAPAEEVRDALKTESDITSKQSNSAPLVTGDDVKLPDNATPAMPSNDKEVAELSADPISGDVDVPVVPPVGNGNAPSERSTPGGSPAPGSPLVGPRTRLMRRDRMYTCNLFDLLGSIYSNLYYIHRLWRQLSNSRKRAR
jgi:hypothetical protein